MSRNCSKMAASFGWMSVCARTLAAFHRAEAFRFDRLRSPALPGDMHGVSVGIEVGRQTGEPGGGTLQPENRDLCLGGSPLCIPPSRPVILVEHRLEIDGATGRRTFFMGFGEHAPGERVVVA
jgi:hypothetical protein